MKVLHVSTSDVGGGAAKAAYKLHLEMLRSGIESRMLVLRKYSDDETVFEYKYETSFIFRLKRKLKRMILQKSFQKYKTTLVPHYESFSQETTEFIHEFKYDWNRFDIIQLHFIAGFVDYSTFFKQVNKPVLWRLADMNPLTGGCHYSWGCNNFENSCGKCPILGSKKEIDLSRKTLRRKHHILSSSQIRPHIIVLSNWMYENVAKSSLFKENNISHIPNGVDLNVFKPHNKSVVRKLLGIPDAKKVLLLIADHLNNPRKGIDIAFAALSQIENKEDFHLLLVGNLISDIPWKGSYDYFGIISEKRFLSQVYAAADFFLSTSLEENFANTIIESMACGTPAIAFNIGGVPDAVIDNKTGYLVNPKTSTSLLNRIKEVTSDVGGYVQIRTNALERSHRYYDLKKQAQAYISLYRSYL